MFNTFLKNILKYYCWGYRRTTSFGIFQRVEKELLQISLLLLTLWHNYRWYSIGDIIFTNIYIVRKIKVPDIIAYGIPSVIWQTSREKYRRNEVDKFFLRVLSVCKSISKFITDRPKINDKSFSDGLFLSVSLSIKYLPMDYEYKYWRKFPSIKLLNLIVKYPKIFEQFEIRIIKVSL